MRAMRAVAWRSLKRRRMRTFFTAAAIALGVANVFGVYVTNESMQFAVERRARAATGGADAIASGNVDRWLGDDDIERLSEFDGVRRTVRWGTYKGLASPGESWIFAQAMDLTAGAELIEVHEGRLPRSGAAEIALTETAARILGVDVGDGVVEGEPKELKREPSDEPQQTPDPRYHIERPPAGLKFDVTAIIADHPTVDRDDVYGSYTPIGYAFETEEPDVVLQLGILLDEGVDVDGWTTQAEAAFPHLRIESSLGPRLLRDFLTQFRSLLAGTAALALFIGAFLIYLIFTLALAERTRLFGLLHAVGASRTQVASAVLREALMLGLVATIVGVVVGLGLATAFLRIVSSIGDLGISAPLRLSVPSFVAAIVVGVVATLVGAAVPAVRAARMVPVEAVTGRTAPPAMSRAWIAGVLLLALGILTVVVRGLSADAIGQLAVICVLLGAVFVVPLAIAILARTTKSIVTRLVPGSGIVVFRRLTKESGRSAYTLALVMLVLAAVVTLMTADRSLRTNVDRVIDARFGADLIVYGPKLVDAEEDIRTVDGISGATTMSFGRTIGIVSAKSETTTLVLIDPAAFFDIAGFPWQQGNDRDARRALMADDAVLVPARLAKRHELSLGDTIRLRWGTHEQDFDVAGTYDGGTGPELGIVANMHRGPFEVVDGDRMAIYMNFDTDVDKDRVLDGVAPVLRKHGELDDRFRWTDAEFDERGLSMGPYFAISGADIKEGAREELSSYVRLFSTVIGVIVVGGALGMATALATSVVLRTRELGTIVAVGATRADVRMMIVSESFLLVAAAYVLSIGLGGLLSWLFIDGVTELTGTTVRMNVAWAALPAVGALALLIAIVAAYAPARRAMRITPVEALRYE